MKWFICLMVSLTLTVVLSKPSSSERHQDIKQYQDEILKLYQGLGFYFHDKARGPFPYADPSYYTMPNASYNFVNAYENGFLDKAGFFNLYSYKNRHDTYRLFDLFYFAKDFGTFMKISKWAKSELHPLQFVYAFTAAVYQRKDTEGVIAPPFFEVLPQYFTPANVMTTAYKAMIQDVNYLKLEVNTTGNEWSWYKEHNYRANPKSDDYDPENRLSYYREDVSFNDWYSKFFLYIAPWLGDEKYPDIHWERRGEYVYTILKTMLNKYNLERYANGLPPVEPINFWKVIKTGYNPGLSNINGRPFYHRPDGLKPHYTNPAGMEYLENMFQRYLGEIESYSMYDPLNKSSFSIDGLGGFENFAKIFYGISHPDIRKYYRPMYYQALETIDGCFQSANDVAYTGSTLIHFLTEHRDPIFYQMLAYLDQLFEAYNKKKSSYTMEEVQFPGVELSSIDFSSLETYFERYEYDISYGVPAKKDTGKYKYLVSQYRLNHKPFNYKLEIKSDKDVDATVKVFFAPKFDSSFRPYGFTGFSKYAMGFETFHVSLKAGSNTIERKSQSNINFKETPRMKHILEELNQSQQKSEPLHYSNEYQMAFPTNLALPRGSSNGTQFQVMGIVFPKGFSDATVDCEDEPVVQEFDENKFLLFPFDRPITASTLEIPNAHFSEVIIKEVITNH